MATPIVELKVRLHSNASEKLKLFVGDYVLAEIRNLPNDRTQGEPFIAKCPFRSIAKRVPNAGHGQRQKVLPKWNHSASCVQ
jgi:hypothetical protein